MVTHKRHQIVTYVSLLCLLWHVEFSLQKLCVFDKYGYTMHAVQYNYNGTMRGHLCSQERLSAGILLVKDHFLYSAVSKLRDCSEWFTLYSLTDPFNQTPSWLLWTAVASMQRCLREDYSFTNASQILSDTVEFKALATAGLINIYLRASYDSVMITTCL